MVSFQNPLIKKAPLSINNPKNYISGLPFIYKRVERVVANRGLPSVADRSVRDCLWGNSRSGLSGFRTNCGYCGNKLVYTGISPNGSLIGNLYNKYQQTLSN